MPSSAMRTRQPTNSGNGLPRFAWATVAFLWFAFLLNYLDRQVVFSIFPVLRADLGFSERQLGLIGATFIWVYSVCTPLSGRLADLMRRDRLIVSSLVLWSVATLGTGLSTSVPVFLFWRAVMGLTESLYMPAALTTIAVLHSGATRSKALAIHSSAQFAGIVTGGWYGGWTADRIGWRLGFMILAVTGVAYGIAIRKVFNRLPRFPIADASSKALPKVILRSTCYWALALSFFAFCTMLWMLYAWFPSFIYDRYHLSMTESSIAATVYLQISCIAGVLTGGVFADWLVQRIPSGRFLITGAGLIGSAPFAFLSLAGGSLAMAKLSAAAFGFFAGVFVANVFAAAYDVISKQAYGLAAGILNLIGGLAGGAGILAAGFWKASLGMAFLMKWQAIASCACALLLLLVVMARFPADYRRALGRETA
jgi:MFS family permease